MTRTLWTLLSLILISDTFKTRKHLVYFLTGDFIGFFFYSLLDPYCRTNVRCFVYMYSKLDYTFLYNKLWRRWLSPRYRYACLYLYLYDTFLYMYKKKYFTRFDEIWNCYYLLNYIPRFQEDQDESESRIVRLIENRFLSSSAWLKTPTN